MALPNGFDDSVLREGRIVSDRLFVKKVVDGERGARTAFVERFHADIRKYLNSRGLPQDRVEDLYQQLYVHLLEDTCRRLRQWRGETTLKNFIICVVARLVLDDLRKSRRMTMIHSWRVLNDVSADYSHEIVDPVQIIQLNYRRETVHRALTDMRANDAELISRRHIEGKSYREIGEAMGMTTGHVGVALMRAEKKLKEELRERL